MARCAERLLTFLVIQNIWANEVVFNSEDQIPMITLLGAPYANYTWDGDTDIPTFEFLGKYSHLNSTSEMYKQQIISMEQS